MIPNGLERERSAEQLAERLPLTEPARLRVVPGQSARAFFERLMEDGLLEDAIKVLPHLLNKRRAVWWGCLCMWEAMRSRPEARREAALEAAVRWVVDPGEETRRAAEKAGQQAEGLTTAAGALALAAFWSEGSMTGPGLPAVLPPAELAASVVSGAILLAAAEQAPLRLPQAYGRFLMLGQEVAGGRLLWESECAREPVRSSLVEAQV